MPDETPIPSPYDIAVELKQFKESKVADIRMKTYCDLGLMLYWVANEINNLVIILQPNVPIQNEAETVPSEGPSEDGEGETGRSMDADEERQIEGSD